MSALNTEARRLARLEIFTELKRTGVKVSSVSAMDISNMVKICVKEFPQYKIQAFANITKSKLNPIKIGSK